MNSPKRCALRPSARSVQGRDHSFDGTFSTRNGPLVFDVPPAGAKAKLSGIFD